MKLVPHNLMHTVYVQVFEVLKFCEFLATCILKTLETLDPRKMFPQIVWNTVKTAIYNFCGERPPGVYDQKSSHG